jgi:hypothetical protein
MLHSLCLWLIGFECGKLHRPCAHDCACTPSVLGEAVAVTPARLVGGLGSPHGHHSALYRMHQTYRRGWAWSYPGCRVGTSPTHHAVLVVVARAATGRATALIEKGRCFSGYQYSSAPETWCQCRTEANNTASLLSTSCEHRSRLRARVRRAGCESVPIWK